MIHRRLFRSSAVLATGLASLFPHGPVKAQSVSMVGKLRESVLSGSSLGTSVTTSLPGAVQERFPWKTGIVTTTFWIGEKATKRNPVPNHASSWDPRWAENFGGSDEPDAAGRADFLPVSFVPRQNPFYVALPYNDVTKGTTKPEASLVIPWFKQAYQASGKTVCKGRWLAIRFGSKTCYAQWEDCGPFRTDHWQYVFGNERPKPNLNQGAGLDVSPAVRDFLGMNDTDVTDWKFVEFGEVPQGPWALHGDNNTFVMLRRSNDEKVASIKPAVAPVRAEGLTPGSLELFQVIR